MNDRSKSYDECCNIIDNIVYDNKMYGATMVQQYGQATTRCMDSKMYGAATWTTRCMEQQWDNNATWCCNDTTMGQQRQLGSVWCSIWYNNGQWHIVHNEMEMVQWYNMGQLVFSAANSWCCYGMAKHNGTTMTLCSNGTMGQP